MTDYIQDDLNVNLNSVVQTMADVTTDYVLANKIMPMFGVDMELNVFVSTAYHVADEIIFPALVDALDDILDRVPLIGNWLVRMLKTIKRQEYVKIILRIILIGMIQKTFSGRTDFLEGSIMFISTYSINFATEIDAVKSVLDWEIDL